MINVSIRTWGGVDTASTRYRVLYLKKYIEKRGIKYNIIDTKKFLREKAPSRLKGLIKFTENLYHASKSDILLIQKSRLSKWKLDLIGKVNKHVVYDIDDALYAVPPWKKDAPEKSDYIKRRKKVNDVLKRVSHVIVGSPIIKEYTSKFCENVFVAPTSLPKDKYIRYYRRHTEEKSTFVVGWIGNEENLWYLEQVESAIEAFLTEQKKSELHIVTASNPSKKPLSHLIGNKVRYIEWSEAKEIGYIDQFDVAIRPLTDDKWTRSKGGFTSVIQCMATGKPVVVSPVGILENIVRHGREGYHASEPDDWIGSLIDLANNPSKRLNMGRKAFERVGEKRLWTHQRADDLASFYKSIVK
jgi:glycosyltransferase involved in cell wall biosynthesis